MDPVNHGSNVCVESGKVRVSAAVSAKTGDPSQNHLAIVVADHEWSARVPLEVNAVFSEVLLRVSDTWTK